MTPVSSLLVSASFLASISFLALGPTPALAASPTDQAAACEATAGCVYSKDASNVSCNCTSVTTQGNGPKAQSKITTNTDTTTNGNLDNAPQKDEKTDCSGPGGSTNHCN